MVVGKPGADDGAKGEEKHADDAMKKQRRATSLLRIFEEEQEPEGQRCGRCFVGANAEFGKVPSQAGSRALAVGLNMGWG